ncbi:hypothetical protein, partial [Cohnella sp.]|uniref:hypothetical protein n=1 Tax=Cohnella sp. TaxID=1883426 RepID=UPI0035647D2A
NGSEHEEDCPPTRKEGIRVISPSDFNDPLSKNEEKPLRLKRRRFLDDLRRLIGVPKLDYKF